MRDWNVVATIRNDDFKRACQILQQFGELGRTRFYNVVVLKVGDLRDFLERLSALAVNAPETLRHISRAIPCMSTFSFRDEPEFQNKAREVALGWSSQLSGKSFHVRMHRRGMKDGMSSQVEERFLDDALLTALEASGMPGSITFEDPDFIIDVETIGNQAGLSLWSRADLVRYPFLHVD